MIQCIVFTYSSILAHLSSLGVSSEGARLMHIPGPFTSMRQQLQRRFWLSRLRLPTLTQSRVAGQVCLAIDVQNRSTNNCYCSLQVVEHCAGILHSSVSIEQQRLSHAAAQIGLQPEADCRVSWSPGHFMPTEVLSTSCHFREVVVKQNGPDTFSPLTWR